MGFKNDFSEINSNGLKPEGDYECIITAIEERTTKNGATGLNISMVIRNDVQGQKYGNAMLFYTLWKRRQPTEMDMQVNGYSFRQVMALGKAAGLPDGKDYASLKEYCNDLLNKCVKATLEHELYQGKMQERVQYLYPTNHPDCKHVFKKSTPKSDGFAPQAAQQSFAGKTDQPPLTDLSGFEDVLSDDGVPF